MFKKIYIIYTCLIILSLISLLSSILGFYRLDRIPYGFHVDEMSGSVDVGCMATEGVDAHNLPHPMFSNLNYGTPKPPTFIYPAVLWAKFFGYSVASLRAMTVSVHLLGIIGLFFLGRALFGWQCGILVVTVASLSPWTWGLSRVAFESLFSSTFLIWGTFLFFKKPRFWTIIVSSLLFSASMYSYPPFRLQTPLMLLTFIFYSRYSKNPWTLKSWIIFILVMFLSVIPLIQRIFSGELQDRFNSISIFNKDYLNSINSSGSIKDILEIFINNYFQHFKPNFLFLKGDPSYVHSTEHFGILGWLDIAALGFLLIWLILLFNKHLKEKNPLISHKNFILFLLANILIGVLPAALTNSELPNSLRITGAWPFVCLLSGFILWKSCECWWGIWIATSILSILFSIVYFNIYFKVFPQEGKGMFSYWTLDEANQIKTDQNWLKFVLIYRHQDYNARYFLMQYRRLTCTQSRVMWEGVRDYLIKRGTYQ